MKYIFICLFGILFLGCKTSHPHIEEGYGCCTKFEYSAALKMTVCRKWGHYYLDSNWKEPGNHYRDKENQLLVCK